MATNANRVLIHTQDYSSVRMDVYSTGAAYFRWVYDGPKNSTRDLIRITNSKDLLESGHLEKFAKLLEDESTHRISSKSFADVLEYIPSRDGESFRHIIDSSLEPLAKVIYLISYASLKFPLGKEELDLIFSKRPDPEAEWSSHATVFRTEEKNLVRYSLMPGFYSPELFKDRDSSGYRRIALTSAFIHSKRSLTHGEFMEEHKDDFFIPHLAVNMNEVYFRNFPPEVLADLRPAEYVRFMEYFTRDVPAELAKWAKERFTSGVVTLKESRSKGSAKLQPGNMRNWMGVANLLTLEEARAFQTDIMEPNGIGNISSGVEKKLSPLLAYYYAEGGKTRFNELVQHIIANGPGLHREVFRGTELQFNWKNPYSDSKARRPNLRPYVEALAGENMDYPLEWSLAVIDVR